MIANLRLILDVEVQTGNQSASSYSAPGLWSLLERIPKEHWPRFIRGDCDWGNDGIMTEAEQLGMDYLFKLRKCKKTDIGKSLQIRLGTGVVQNYGRV